MVRRKLAAVVPRNLKPWNPAQPVVAAIARITRVRTGVRDDGRSPSMSLSPTPPSMAIGTEGVPRGGARPSRLSRTFRADAVQADATRRDRRAATHHSRTAGE